MFYVLLVFPHLVAIAALLAYALRSTPVNAEEDGYGESGGPEGGSDPPLDRSPEPPGDHPLLADADAPRRRTRDGERLSDLHPRPLRRGHPTHQPSRPGISDIR